MACLSQYNQIVIISELEVKDESDSRESDVEVVDNITTNEGEFEGRGDSEDNIVREDALTEAEEDEETADDEETEDREELEYDEEAADSDEAEDDDEEEIVIQVQTKPSYNQEETDTEEDINSILNELPPIEEFVSDEVKAEETTYTYPKFSVKCGEVFLVPENKFTLVCAICSNCFEGFESFGRHIHEHHSGINSKQRNVRDSHVYIPEKCPSNTSLDTQKFRHKMKELRVRIQKTVMHKNDKISRQSAKASAVSLLTPLKSKGRSKSRSNNKKSKPAVHACPRCHRTFAMKSALGNHLNKCNYAGKDVTVCKYCDKKFTDMEAVKDHIKKKHSGLKKFGCPYCPKRFSMRWHRQYHIKTHTGEHPYKCPHCNLTFISKANQNAHIHKHLPVKNVQCSYCEKGFRTDSAKRRHELTQKCLKVLRCSICEQSFCNKRRLKDHENFHSIKKPFSCKKCDTSFDRKSKLISHMQVHSNVKHCVCKLTNFHGKNNHKT